MAPTDPPTTTSTTVLEGEETTDHDVDHAARGQAHHASSRRGSRRSRLLQSIKPQIKARTWTSPAVQLVGTYPIEGTGEDDVVQVLYSKATVQGNLPGYLKMFDVPPAEVVQCLNPAFDLP